MDQNKFNLIVKDYLAKYELNPLKSTYVQIYETSIHDKSLSYLFSKLHQRLNDLFGFMNQKSTSNAHYNANESRELLSIIEDLDELKQIFKGTKYHFHVSELYETNLEFCRNFLSSSGGSAIPEDYKQIVLIKYDPIFFLLNNTVVIPNSTQNIKLQLVGEGTFAFVHKYYDEFYGKIYAKKTLKRDASDREKLRFLKEYKVMKRMNFPYILEVYNLLDDNQSYLMEYCDEDIGKFISSCNSTLKFATRKKIALQFLYAINYIHSKKLFHRDISFRNILIKKYDGSAVTIKLSDFGLVKESDSTFTKSDTEYKGSIIDPAIDVDIDKFKDYGFKQEVYPIGVLLQFIFTGRKSIEEQKIPQNLRTIIKKCTNTNLEERYNNTKEVIDDVEALSKLE